jgi:AraC-like DNA-binding protein
MTATVLTWTPSSKPAGVAAMAEPTVGAGFARGLLGFAVRKGADRQLLLTRSGIAASSLEDQDARVPFQSYVALMRAGQELTGDTALALHYGEGVDIADVSVIGLIGQASETMTEAFRQLNRFVRLIVETDNEGDGDRFGIRVDAAGLWMVDTRRNPNDFPELTESALAQLVCGPRRFDDTPFVRAVHVTHPAPPHAKEYERVFRAPIVFNSDRNGLLVDPTWATHKVARLPRYAFGVLTEHADALLQTLEGSKSVRGRVERLLMPVLHTGAANMETVASQLGMSRQTLFRKLKAEGVTFATVLDELRHRMAADYLGARRVSVNETAYLVGFSEPAAFSRAFKRWTGCSPGAMRAAAAGQAAIS